MGFNIRFIADTLLPPHERLRKHIVLTMCPQLRRSLCWCAAWPEQLYGAATVYTVTEKK